MLLQQAMRYERTQSLARSALILLVFFYGCSPSKNRHTFYVFSDTHCLDSLNRYQVLDSMITEANDLHRNEFPDTLKYLKKQLAKGVLVCGDITDGARQSQLNQFTELFGIHGERHLKVPVYENYGNHDGDTTGVVRTAIRQRNRLRRNVAVSANGMHYSWNWGSYHFVSLGSYPGSEWDSSCNWCHYFKSSFRDPQNSLDFLKQDLQSKSASGRRVILYFHYGWDSFSTLWWTEKEQQQFYEVIKNYNIAAIFTGHNHATGYLKWKGIDVYSAGSPQSGSKTGSFLFVQATKDSLYVIERRLNNWGLQSYKKAVL